MECSCCRIQGLRWRILRRVLFLSDKSSSCDLLIHQTTVLIEGQFNIDGLETALAADNAFAGKVHILFFRLTVLDAQVIAHVYVKANFLMAASTFNVHPIEVGIHFSTASEAGEEVLDETQSKLLSLGIRPQ